MLHHKDQTKTGVLRRNSSVNINETRIAGLYDLEHTIGKGHFAVAVKVIDKTKLDAESAADLMQEVRCMKLVQHPNIVRLYEVIDTQTKLFLILELGDYDMYDYIMRTSEKGCKESEAQQYFSQIIKAIDYCHALHVVHRDLKPENVVFFEKLGMVKLTDFGFSNLYTPGQQLSTSCGSLAYSAPEILLGDAYDAPAVDIWSLGVILYMLVCGRLPFQEANESETLTRILDCRYSIPDSLSSSCKELIQKMLVRDPTKRATLDFITKSSWVKAGDRGHAEVLPLISRTNLSDSAHNTIVDQMVAGGIGTEENILNAIDQGEYSYLTATYYLLAERVLAAQRMEQALQLRDTTNTGGTMDDEESSANANHQINNSNRSRSNSWRGPSGRRACTILKEESEEELSTYLRSSSRQSSRYFTKRDNVHAASRAASLESFRSGGGQTILEGSDSFDADSWNGTDERKLAAKKLSIIQADDDEEDTENRPLIVEEDTTTNSTTCSPKVVSTGGLSFGNSFAFDELSPIRELIEANFGAAGPSEVSPSHETPANEPVDDECPPTNRRSSLSWQRAVSSSDEDDRRGLSRRRRFNSSRSIFKGTNDSNDDSTVLLRTPSAPIPINQLALNKLTRRFVPPMQRRNSSPSVSMFGPSGLRSSCDRVSPQAIQELLEFSRLSATMKRAASPESRISSRSPSPPCSSGRASPSISSVSSMVTRLKSSNLLANTSGGMRKLSSSPHLLGICEETDEINADSHPSTFYTVQTHKTSLVSSGASLFTVGASDVGKLNGSLGRGMRSASTGFAASNRTQRSIDSISDLPVLQERASSAAAVNPPHSNFRLVRPRAGMVSPDLSRRFDQHHRFVARSRRSTSETSDDDTNERRLNLIGQTHCRRFNSEDRPRPDDEPPSSGTNPNASQSSATAANPSTTHTKTTESSTNQPSNSTDGQSNSGQTTAGLVLLQSTIRNHDTIKVFPEVTFESKSTIFVVFKPLFKGKPPILATDDELGLQDAGSRYILSMFPYPSGRLHLGHMRVYSISDVLARYYRLNGFRMFHPIGWDAFGLPAENAARSMGVQASEWTKQNIADMREQLRKINVQFDWDAAILSIIVGLSGSSLTFTKQGSCIGVLPRLTGILLTKRFWPPSKLMSMDDRGALVQKSKNENYCSGQLKHQNTQSGFLMNGDQNGETLDLRVFDPSEFARADFVILHSDHPLADENKEHQYLSDKRATNFVTGRELPIIVLASKEEERCEIGEFHLKARLGFAAKSAFDKSLSSLFGVENSEKQDVSADRTLNLGGYETSRSLEDWVVSRQRDWGTPIPMILNGNETRAYPLDKLPLLSDQRGQEFDGGKIETDTLDTFFDSSWYYLRYLDPHNSKTLADLDKLRQFMPVDVGGIEHADVHLFFARFISYFLYDIGATNVAEPFQRLLPQGIVRGRTFVELKTGRYVPPNEVEQEKVEVSYEKMSKSKSNGVDPLAVIEDVGVDLTRLQLLAAAAPRAHLNWGESDLKGLRKWIERIDWIVDAYVRQRRSLVNKTDVELVTTQREEFFRENYNYFVRNVSACLEVYNVHNTAIARLQGLTNSLRKLDPDEAGRSIELERCIHALIFAPETAETLWSKLCEVKPISSQVRRENTPLSQQFWPQVDDDAEIDFTVTMLETSCSRASVPRTAIETLGDVQLIELAKNDQHKAFFDLLSKHGVDVQSVIVNRRPDSVRPFELATMFCAIREWFFGSTEVGYRRVIVGDANYKLAKNRISTTKYTMITFLPKFLSEQFSNVVNVFFLILACAQLLPMLDPPYGRATTMMPLGFILFLAAGKEIFEDVRRKFSDREINRTIARVFNRVNGWRNCFWYQIRVGEIVRVENGEKIPADLVLLSSSESNGQIYIETSNLDGESNLKIRQALTRFTDRRTFIHCDLPNCLIYEFQGSLHITPEAATPNSSGLLSRSLRTPKTSEQSRTPGEVKVFSLTQAHLMPRGARLMNTEYAFGVVVYAGKHTKLMMNQTRTPRKHSNVNQMTNYIMMVQFGILMIMSASATALSLWTAYKTRLGTWYLPLQQNRIFVHSRKSAMFIYFSELMLFSRIIPISLIITLEFIRLIQAWFIENSKRSQIHNFIMAMACCHTVVPEVDKTTNEINYYASSQDEGALVRAAAGIGFVFYKRTPEKLVVNVDTMIFDRLAPTEKEVIQRCQEHLQRYAESGYRTLCVGTRTISPAVYHEWNKGYHRASIDLDNRNQLLSDAAEEIEKDLVLLGATAIEDKLQDVRVWILTGDKRETAVNVAQSSGLCTKSTGLLILDNVGADTMVEKLHEYVKAIESYKASHIDFALIVSADSLREATKNESRTLFTTLAWMCRAVVCCRMTPSQKAEVVKMVKSLSSDVVLAIGDGGNDVAMIQAAHFMYTFFNGNSEEGLIDQWTVILYNILFTSLAPMWLGVFDQPTSLQQMIKHNRYYALLQPVSELSFKSHAIWIMRAVCHAILIFVVVAGIHYNEPMFANGIISSTGSFGTICALALIVVVNIRAVLEIDAINWIVAALPLLSIASYATFLAIYPLLHRIMPDIFDLYMVGVFNEVFTNPVMYCALGFIIFTVIVGHIIARI
ncbi:Leucyl-tRNA synthetase [Aphelenchoides besseyi]|nr:Leucyl-tRNA synthetase [Aphelenchoides besseyi]